MMIPLTPYYAKLFHASDTTIGMLTASFAVAQFLFAPFWGILSDRFGRKPIIVIGLLGMAVSFLFFALASTLPMLFFSRFLQGTFSSAILPTARAYMADLTTAKERVRAMGHLAAFLALGIIFGPVIGGSLSEIDPIFPFLTAMVVATLNAGFVVIFLKESLSSRTKLDLRFKRLVFQNFRAVFHGLQSPIAPLLILAFLWSFGVASVQKANQLFSLEILKLNNTKIGTLFAVFGATIAIIQFFFLSSITSRVGQHRTVALGLLSLALGSAVMPFIPHLFFFYVAAVVAGIGSAVARPVITALISEETTEEQGVTMGTATAFESIGRFVGPLLGGGLFAVGFHIPFLLPAVITLFVLLFVVSRTHFLKKGAL